MEFKVLLLCCAITFVVAQDSVEEEEQAEPTGLEAIGLPGELFSHGAMRAIGIASAIVTGVAGLAAVLSFLLPMFGVRTCMFMGNCDDSASYAQANSVYDPQGFSGYTYGGGFKKRSLEYVGPILKALTSAYEKYGPPAQQRKGFGKAVDGRSAPAAASRR